ncbi:MAG: folate-binding protein YgfZ [Rhizobiales bacterium]|nr:folate-binding protein YgfZ [Hyphomicrobiales bacterium]
MSINPPSSAIETLPGRGVLAVTGVDAAGFLQGLVTSDVEGLQPGAAGYAALLTPQGKILFDFLLQRQEDGFLIDCAAAQREALIKRLGFYKLRAKVTVEPRDDLNVVVADEPAAGLYADPRLADLGYRGFSAQKGPGGNRTYDARRIGLGIADSEADMGSGELFPHEANLDQLNGVSFTKGCYVGQEVVSRMEHRGTARNRILPLKLDGAAPPKGTPIRAGEKQIGTLLSSAGDRALGLIRLDRLADAARAGDRLLTDSVPVHVFKPAFARFDLVIPQAA